MLFFLYIFSLASSRGILIAFEGGDKSGKSTQSRHLSYLLNTVGIDSKLIKFPDFLMFSRDWVLDPSCVDK